MCVCVCVCVFVCVCVCVCVGGCVSACIPLNIICVHACIPLNIIFTPRTALSEPGCGGFLVASRNIAATLLSVLLLWYLELTHDFHGMPHDFPARGQVDL